MDHREPAPMSSLPSRSSSRKYRGNRANFVSPGQVLTLTVCPGAGMAVTTMCSLVRTQAAPMASKYARPRFRLST